MSTGTPRQRLGKLFNRRDVSNPTSEPATSGPPPANDIRENKHVRRKSSLRSLREFVQNTGRSLSRTRKRPKDGHSYDAPEHGDVHIAAPNFPYAEDSLPQIAHQTDLGSDLAHLVLTETNDPRPRIDSAADQPILRRKVRKLSHEDRRTSPRRYPRNVVHIDTMMEPADDPYSELVADWNIGHGETPLVGALDDLPAPLKVVKSRSSDLSTGSPGSRYMPGQLSHKPDVQDLRRSLEQTENGQHGRRRRSSTRGRIIRRSSLDKPLPELPIPLIAQNRESVHDLATEGDLGRERGYLVKDSSAPIDLKGVVDLSNTVDTHVETKWSPAVTHEIRTVNTHEIVQRAITREIHNHHVFHRVLPIMDIEILPARHFVPTQDGRLAEIAAEDAPVDSGERLQQLISEAVASMLPKTEGQAGPRQFSARAFEGTDGDFREYTTPEGFKRTEQWWVHPPSVDTGAEEAGQTTAFHMDSANHDDDDGFKDPIPNAVASIPASSSPYGSPSQWSGVSNMNMDPTPLSVPTHHTIVPIKMTHGAAVPQQVY